MDWENLLALVAAVALVGYLVYALIRRSVPDMLVSTSSSRSSCSSPSS